jgi:hypothetical protein
VQSVPNQREGRKVSLKHKTPRAEIVDVIQYLDGHNVSSVLERGDPLVALTLGAAVQNTFLVPSIVFISGLRGSLRCATVIK